jgi:hypothetical protein
MVSTRAERIERGAVAPHSKRSPQFPNAWYALAFWSAAVFRRLSSAVASDFAFAWILGTNGESDSAPRRELRGHDCLARRACFHEIIQNAVRDRFIEGALIPIRSKIKLERFAFDAKTVGHVIDVDPGKIWLTRDWTNRSEIVGFKVNPIIPTGCGIWKGLEPRF